MAATALSSSAPPPEVDLKLQFPVFAHGARPERAVRLRPQPFEARFAVDGARCGEMGVRPKHHLAIALPARERDALVNQPPAEARAPRLRLDEEQAELRHGSALLDDEHRAEPLTVTLGDPAALALRVEVVEEGLDDLSDQRLEARPPAVLLVVERRVALHHPAHVARPVLAQDDLARLRVTAQDRLHGLRSEEHTSELQS